MRLDTPSPGGSGYSTNTAGHPAARRVARSDRVETASGARVETPLVRGLLPGILRRKLLEPGDAVEGDLTVDDLSGGFFIGNSVRGLVAATLARQSVGETKEVCN